MRSIITILILCLSQLTVAQKEDSLLLVIDQVEISSIISPNEIKLYFKDISDLIRISEKSEKRVISNFGYKSPQHDSVLLLKESIKSFLFLKMREYLSIHQYPKRIAGDTIRDEENPDHFFVSKDVIASSTLIKIFVNAPETAENHDLKKLYFPKFYQAFKSGDVYSGDLWNLLYRIYHQEKNEEYVNFELGEDEQIEEMINHLQLERRAPN